MSILFDIWHGIQQYLFPTLERDTDPLTEKEKHFIVLTMTDLPFHMREYQWQGVQVRSESFASAPPELLLLKLFMTCPQPIC